MFQYSLQEQHIEESCYSEMMQNCKYYQAQVLALENLYLDLVILVSQIQAPALMVHRTH